MTRHRPRHVYTAERVRIETGMLTKTTHLVRCGRCDEVVTLRHGQSRDTWVHGMPEGTIEVLS